MKKKVRVYGKKDFRRILGDIDLSREAVISIECSEECAKYWLEEEKGDYDNEHLLPSGPSVLNLNFDDVEGPGDKYYKGHWFKSFKLSDAAFILEFLSLNSEKDLIIHCKAGKSRSKAVGQFILDLMGDEYEDGNPENPINGSCNLGILLKLKNEYYSRNKLYWCSDERMKLTKKSEEDLGHPIHFLFDEEYGRKKSCSYKTISLKDVFHLIGAIDGADGNFYLVVLNNKGNLNYYPCEGKYTVIHDYRQYSSLKEEDIKFPEGVDLKKIKETVIEDVRRWGKNKWSEEQIILTFMEDINPISL